MGKDIIKPAAVPKTLALAWNLILRVPLNKVYMPPLRAKNTNVDDRNIIQHLMQGTVASAESRDHARNAREIVLGSRIINEVMASTNWLEKDNPIDEKQFLKDDLKSNFEFTNETPF